MFGLVTRKSYDELNRKLMNKLIVNESNAIKIKELEAKLTLEKTKSLYWKFKSKNNNADMIIVGTADEIAYIREEENELPKNNKLEVNNG